MHQPNLVGESQILREIEKRRPDLSVLALVDEIWLVETPFYTAFGGTFLQFDLYDSAGEPRRSLDFNEGKLVMTEGMND